MNKSEFSREHTSSGSEPVQNAVFGSGMRTVFIVLLSLIAAAYPFLVYWGLKQFEVRILALVLACLFAVRLMTMRGNQGFRRFLPLVVVVLLTSLTAFLFNDPVYFLINPVLINAVLLLAFGWTLVRPPSMIESFARMMEPDLPDRAIPYCRKVTLVWCVFFTVNGGIAFWTAFWTSIATWTLYNGFIAYILIGALAGGEWVVRRFHMRADDSSLSKPRT